MDGSFRTFFTVPFFVALCLIGTVNQDTGNYATVPTEQPTITNDPLPSRSMSPIDAGVWKVVRVVDGDTLVVGTPVFQRKQEFVFDLQSCGGLAAALVQYLVGCLQDFKHPMK